ncbi:MAG: hypothetical protein ACXWBN_19845 [Acidimicrobiales bacterium]
MADLLFILIVVGFFGLMVLLVKGCDRIIGPDEAYKSPDTAAEPAAAEPVASEPEVAR